MATRPICTQFCLFVTIIAIAGNVAGLSGGRPAHGQEEAAGSPRTIEEVRGLVARLEAHVEHERTQLQKTEASLRRARALLGELDGSRGNQPGVHAQNRAHSPDERRGLRDQAIADKMEWKWSDERATLDSSVREIADGYEVQLDPSKENPGYSLITLTRTGMTVYSWDGHVYSAFVIVRDVLYYADSPPASPGCTVIAHDLKGRKLLWKTGLWGVPAPGIGSIYGNRINLTVDDQHVTVVGNETDGRYIELLDLKTGKTVGNRLVEPEEGRTSDRQGQPGNSIHSHEERQRLRDQAIAEKREWEWSDERATLKASVRELAGEYKARFEPSKATPSALSIRLTHAGEIVYSWKGHEYSVFLVAHDVLYYADFGPGSNGCTLIAFDLKARKVVWKTWVWGIGAVTHSQYQNRINLAIDDRYLTVYGNESFGRYVELLDLNTGKTVGNRLLRERDRIHFTPGGPD
jgi:hypothetical protein